MSHGAILSFRFTESPVTAVAPSLVFGELSVEVPSTASTETNLVTTVKETLTSHSYSRLIAEVEKQYVAITPPDSPEPMGLVCFNHYVVNSFLVLGGGAYPIPLDTSVILKILGCKYENLLEMSEYPPGRGPLKRRVHLREMFTYSSL